MFYIIVIGIAAVIAYYIYEHRKANAAAQDANGAAAIAAVTPKVSGNVPVSGSITVTPTTPTSA